MRLSDLPSFLPAAWRLAVRAALLLGVVRVPEALPAARAQDADTLAVASDGLRGQVEVRETDRLARALLRAGRHTLGGRLVLMPSPAAGRRAPRGTRSA